MRWSDSEPSSLDHRYGRALMIRGALALLVVGLILRPDRWWAGVHFAYATRSVIVEVVSQMIAVSILISMLAGFVWSLVHLISVCLYEAVSLAAMVLDDLCYGMPYVALRRWGRLSGIAAFVLAASLEATLLGMAINWVR
jgi:hypothetical protein